MTTTQPPTARPRRSFATVEVAAVSHLDPRVTSITFAGDLDGFVDAGPTRHLKLLVPAVGEHTVPLPEPGPGRPTWPDGQPRPAVRTYTPRRVDPTGRRLEIVFFHHGQGAASAWAAQAVPGDRLAVAGPGGRLPLDLEVRRWVIAGDESAAPAIGTLLDALPGDAEVTVHVEVGGAPVAEAVGRGPDAPVTWVRPPAGGPAGSGLLAALADVPIDPDTNVWVATEATAVRRIRRALLATGRVDEDRLVTRGYWKAGTADHPDHDYGTD